MGSTGNRLSVPADDSRAIVKILCDRVLRPDYESGIILRCPETADDLISVYHSDLSRIVTAQEWDEALLRVQSWYETKSLDGVPCGRKRPRESTSVKDIMSSILQRHGKFPSVGRVAELLGDESAEEYRAALESMETNPSAFSRFPDERVVSGWNMHTCERAVSLVVNVIAPYVAADDPDGMATSYGMYSRETKVRSRDISNSKSTDRTEKKLAARSLGIWLPVKSDMGKWSTDLRTRDRAKAFFSLVSRTMDKMRVIRTVLQFVPKRRLSNATVEDLDTNMDRMRNYLGICL